MTNREKAYKRKLNELMKKTGKLTESEVERVLALLERARTEVAARIAVTEWDQYYIPQLKEAVNRSIGAFSGQYAAGQGEALVNAWNAGIDSVDAPLAYAGIRTMAPELSRDALEILQGFSADLITNLSGDAIKKINSEISLGIMGQKPIHEVMQSVGRNLTDKGVFKSIATRAETITRTEMARVNSMGRQTRIEAMAGKTDPEIKLMKEWVSSGKAKPRATHAALNGVKVPLDEDFPGAIPYPHAPGLSAAESINCGCSHVMFSPDWPVLSKEYEPIQNELRAVYD